MQARALRACAFVAALFITVLVMATLGEMRGRLADRMPSMPWSVR